MPALGLRVRAVLDLQLVLATEFYAGCRGEENKDLDERRIAVG